MSAENNNLKDLLKRKDSVYASNSAFRFPIAITSIYEWRILGFVMLKMQMDFGDYKFKFRGGEDLKDMKPLLDSIRFQKRSFGSQFRSDEVEVAFPLEILLSREKNNRLYGYDKIKKALRRLSRPVEFENTTLKGKLFDDKCKDSGIVWGLFQVIEKPDIRKVDGVNYVYFRVPEKTWEVLCHWEQGIHIVELSVFFKFERAASVPFYILLADHRQKGEVVWPTNYIKEYLAPNEYRDYSSFKKKVLCEVQKDLKEHSPFYFEMCEYVDFECLIPASKGRGRSANYVKIEILYQPDKNLEVDSRIELFREINQLTPFSLADLTEEELNFLTVDLHFGVIKGKNLETIVKLKYYKNYGHQEGANIWRTHPGKYFILYLKRLYDTIMLSDKEIKSIPAYAIKTMQKDLLTYEPTAETPEQLQEKEDAPKRVQNTEFKPSHEQDLKWMSELAQDREWKDAMLNLFDLADDMTLCGYMMKFRDENINHTGHENKKDIAQHFKSSMSGSKDGRRKGWVSEYGTNTYQGSLREEVKNDPLLKDFGLKVTEIKGSEVFFQKI